MTAVLLTGLIEAHSEEITQKLTQTIRNSLRAGGMGKIPTLELQAGTTEVLEHLREWLLTKTDTDIQIYYRQLGARWAWHGATLAECCWTLVRMKDYLWEFLEKQGIVPSGSAIYGEMELLLSLNQFFDRALCHLIEGYEQSDSHEKVGIETPNWPETNMAAWVP